MAFSVPFDLIGMQHMQESTTYQAIFGVNSQSVARELFMRISAFYRTSLMGLVILAALETSASAQFIGAGSTIEGDYLRGVGVAAMGMGIYNEKTAIAEFDQSRYSHSL